VSNLDETQEVADSCRELAVIGFEPFDPGWNFQILGDRVEDSPSMGSVLFADVTSELRNIGGRTSPSANKYLCGEAERQTWR
jgi:hypothetical protein